MSRIRVNVTRSATKDTSICKSCISKRLPPLPSPSIVTMPCPVVDAVAHRDIDAFVWYNKNVQRLFEIVVCPTIPYRCPRILLQVPYVLGSIFTQRKWKNTNRRRTSPETPQISRIMNCLGRRGAWKMDICRKYNIRTQNRRVSIRSSARPGLIRSVKALGTWLSNTLSSIQVYARYMPVLSSLGY